MPFTSAAPPPGDDPHPKIGWAWRCFFHSREEILANSWKECQLRLLDGISGPLKSTAPGGPQRKMQPCGHHHSGFHVALKGEEHGDGLSRKIRAMLKRDAWIWQTSRREADCSVARPIPAITPMRKNPAYEPVADRALSRGSQAALITAEFFPVCEARMPEAGGSRRGSDTITRLTCFI